MTPEIELDWLKRWAQFSPHRIALENGETGETLTYKEFYEQSLGLAHRLRERYDVGPGVRVACLAQNELEYISLFFALQRLGAILVPINFRFTSREVAHIVRDSGARVTVVQDAYLASVETVQAETQVCRFEELTEYLTAKIVSEEFQGEAEKPCMILYTSGTTGFPKGAMITPRMIFWNSVNTGLRLNLTQSDVVLTFLPLFHTGGWNVLTTPCLHRGAKVILLRKFEPETILKLCEAKGVTVLFGVPTTMELLETSPSFASTSLKSVRYAIVGGEPMPLKCIKSWEARGIPIRQGYGLTEFGPNVFSLNEEDSVRKMGSIGFPNFYIDARVVGERGQTLPAGQIGELVLRGPVAMSGYWNNPTATAETLRDGWVHTGDLVRQDAEGYFYVVGRKKEMYISGGENVYPAEIEKVLRQAPGVREAAVIGQPDPKWGESGRAFVVGEDLSPETLRAHCLEFLAKFKVPREFVVLSQLPKTESGKISKTALKDL